MLTTVTVLLHLCTPGDWRTWIDSGEITPPSLDEVGLVHLSAAEQVALPAQRLFPGRDDLVLLVLDPARLDAAGLEVRWEPGVPTDPASMTFPHAYGPVPASAVLTVHPYRPGPDGFTAPELPEPGAAHRAAHLGPSTVRRGASAEEPVTGGVAVRTGSVPASRTHNRLLLDRPHLTDAGTVTAEADRTLVAHGLHPSALLQGPGADDLAADLAAAGWTVRQWETMTAPTGPDPAGASTSVSEMDHDGVRGFRLSCWERTVPDSTADERAELVDRDLADDRVLAVHHLAVVEDGHVVAAAGLRRDGATAWLDALETHPAHRGRGHGSALLARSRALAAEHGCDLIALDADAHDRARDRYLRTGFTVVGTRYEATGPR